MEGRIWAVLLVRSSGVNLLWEIATYGHSIGAANLPDDSLHTMSSVTSTGVYYGFAQVIWKEGDSSLSKEDQQVYPMAMSLGWNPFYKNERLSAVSSPIRIAFNRTNARFIGSAYYA